LRKKIKTKKTKKKQKTKIKTINKNKLFDARKAKVAQLRELRTRVWERTQAE
jgi:hypothetical protein